MPDRKFEVLIGRTPLPRYDEFADLLSDSLRVCWSGVNQHLMVSVHDKVTGAEIKPHHGVVGLCPGPDLVKPDGLYVAFRRKTYPPGSNLEVGRQYPFLCLRRGRDIRELVDRTVENAPNASHHFVGDKQARDGLDEPDQRQDAGKRQNAAYGDCKVRHLVWGGAPAHRPKHKQEVDDRHSERAERDLCDSARLENSD